jgi:hypothetical protein
VLVVRRLYLRGGLADLFDLLVLSLSSAGPRTRLISAKVSALGRFCWLLGRDMLRPFRATPFTEI